MAKRQTIQTAAFANFELSADSLSRVSKDFSIMSDLDNDALDVVFANALGFMLTQLPAEEDEILSEIEEKTSISPYDARRIFRSLGMLIRVLVEDGTSIRDDSDDDLASDLVTLGIITEANRDKFVGIFGSLKFALANGLQALLERDYYNGLFPKFSGMEHSCELRMVPGKKFTLIDDADSYVPSMAGMLAITTLKFYLRNSDSEFVALQLSKKDLVSALNVMKAALKEMELLENVTQSLSEEN